ncbi:MAG: hypothetical protein FJ245_15670 [Nitrospira sp.]|nr:hypothetical protein [Nitrospira sp.]
MDYAMKVLSGSVHCYQELQEEDWVDATLQMAREVRGRSVFLYFEDHRLVASRDELGRVLAEFDESKLDYLCYSFFRASQLDVRNLLPLWPVQQELFSQFYLSDANLALLGRIAPNYYTFSLLSVVSTEYLILALTTENRRRKLFSRTLTRIVTRFMRPHLSRRLFNHMNAFLSCFDAMVCLHHPASPFNLEKLWSESTLGGRKWRYAIPSIELYANYDDDNGVYEESLIKRGLYPFKANDFDVRFLGSQNGVTTRLLLDREECYDCTYYSHHARISRAPVVRIHVARGLIEVRYQGGCIGLGAGEGRFFYSNLRPVIYCLEQGEVELQVFDEAFGQQGLTAHRRTGGQ